MQRAVIMASRPRRLDKGERPPSRTYSYWCRCGYTHAAPFPYRGHMSVTGCPLSPEVLESRAAS